MVKACLNIVFIAGYIFYFHSCMAIDISFSSITGGIFSPKSDHPNLKYYEKLHATAFTHKIVKRGLKDSTHRFNRIKEVSFNALGRDFRLILNPRKGLLHPYFQAATLDDYGNEERIPVDHGNFYEGRVFGEKASEVSAHLEDGIMTASIDTPEETYHVEPAWRHFPSSADEEMIIYRSSDVKHSWDGVGPQKMCDYYREEGNMTVDSEKDVVERFWDIIEDININTVLMFLRDNIVGTVIIISMLIWVPASCVFSYVDRKRESEYRKQCEEYEHVAFRWYTMAMQRRRQDESDTTDEGINEKEREKLLGRMSMYNLANVARPDFDFS